MLASGSCARGTYHASLDVGYRSSEAESSPSPQTPGALRAAESSSALRLGCDRPRARALRRAARRSALSPRGSRRSCASSSASARSRCESARPGIVRPRRSAARARGTPTDCSRRSGARARSGCARARRRRARPRRAPRSRAVDSRGTGRRRSPRSRTRAACAQRGDRDAQPNASSEPRAAIRADRAATRRSLARSGDSRGPLALRPKIPRRGRT